MDATGLFSCTCTPRKGDTEVSFGGYHLCSLGRGGERGAVNCTRLICDLTSSLSLFINCQDDDDDDDNDDNDEDDDIRNDDENHNFQIECHWHVYSSKLHCVSDPFHE